jgi:hypothetical protein
MSEKSTFNVTPETPILEWRDYNPPAAGYIGYWEANGKVFAWLAEDGTITYAVDLI